MYKLCKTTKGEFTTQLRMYNAHIFKEWINVNQCKAWAWLDADTVLGDIDRFIDNNELFWNAHVSTISQGDNDRIYTRGQFTAHHQFRDPNVNSLWKYCNVTSSVSNIISVIQQDKFLTYDEGCYASGIVNQPQISLSIQSGQSDSISNDDPILWMDGRLFQFRKGYTYLLSHFDSWKDQGWPRVDSTHPVLSTLNLSSSGCSGWIDPIYQVCHKSLLDNIALLIKNGTVFGFPKPHEEDPWIREIALFHLRFWRYPFKDNIMGDFSRPILLITKDGYESFTSLKDLDSSSFL